MSSKDERVKKSYALLKEKEDTSQEFTIKGIAEEVGWQPSTARTYVTKKWLPFVFKSDQRSYYYVNGLSRYTEEEYVRLMSQKDSISNEPLRPELSQETERLVVKAREAALLALDLYNRPSATFRTEAYTVLMIIAWTALMHAIFEQREIEFFYREDDGTPKLIDGDEKAWELSTCMKKYFGDSDGPIRKNLEFMIGLRNKIEHRYVPAIDLHVAGECQALILNFDELLTEQFGNYYAIKESLSVPLQTTSIRSGEQIDVQKKFQGRYYDELKDYIETYRGNLPDAIYQDSRFSFRVYLVPKIGNHVTSSDLAFEFVKYDLNKPEDMKALEKQVALIRERQVPVANQGMYKPAQVARIITEKTGREFKVHHHTLAWKMYKVRASGEDPESCQTKYCQFDQAHRDYIYTEEWINFLCKKMEDESEYSKLVAYRE